MFVSGAFRFTKVLPMCHPIQSQQSVPVKDTTLILQRRNRGSERSSDLLPVNVIRLAMKTDLTAQGGRREEGCQKQRCVVPSSRKQPTHPSGVRKSHCSTDTLKPGHSDSLCETELQLSQPWSHLTFHKTPVREKWLKPGWLLSEEANVGMK